MKYLISESVQRYIREFVEFFLRKLEKESPKIKNSFTKKSISSLTDDDVMKIWNILLKSGGTNLGKIIWKNNVIDPLIIKDKFNQLYNSLLTAPNLEERITILSNTFRNANIITEWFRKNGHTNIPKEIADADRYINSMLESQFVSKLRKENKPLHDLYVESRFKRIQNKIESISDRWDNIDISNPIGSIKKFLLSDSVLLKTMRSASYEAFLRISKKEDEILQQIEKNLKTLVGGTLDNAKPIMNETYLLANSLKKFKNLEIDGLLELLNKELVKILRNRPNNPLDVQTAMKESGKLIEAIKKSNPYDAERWNTIITGSLKPNASKWAKGFSTFLRVVEAIINTAFLGISNLIRVLAKQFSRYGIPKGILMSYLWIQGQKFLILLIYSIVRFITEMFLQLFSEKDGKEMAQRISDVLYDTYSSPYIDDSVAKTVWNILWPINWRFYFDKLWSKGEKVSRGEVTVDLTPVEWKAFQDTLSKMGISLTEVKKQIDTLRKEKEILKRTNDSLLQLTTDSSITPLIIDLK